MNIDFYERIWMWMAGVIVVLFMSFVGASTFSGGCEAFSLFPAGEISASLTL